jgi:phospholipid N-methyltransferase
MQRRDLGAYYTPAETADAMVALLEVRRDDRVLDPAAGDGALIAALLRTGVRPEQITAWDIDADACSRLRSRFPGIKVERRDTLLDTPLGETSGRRWDRIIANPPYLNKASAYVRRNRVELAKRYRDAVGAGETYAMFLHLALELLAPGGAVVFITSDTIRSLGTHERLRRRILAEFHVRSIVETPDRLFPGASVDATILDIRSADDSEVPETEIIRADGQRDKIPTETFTRIDGAPFALSAPDTVVALFDQPLRLVDRARSHIGMHTRDNRHRIAALAGSPLADRFQRNRRNGDRPVITADEAASEAWRPYLKEGGDKDYHHPIVEFLDWRPQARRGYVIPHGGLFGLPGICVSGISRRLSARVMPAGCHWDSNKVIGLVPVDPGERDLLLGLLNSDLYTYIAKHLLNDSSSLQIRDLRRLPVPDVGGGARTEIAGLAASAVVRREADPDADVVEIGRRLDTAVYDALGVTAEDRELIAAELAASGRHRR